MKLSRQKKTYLDEHGYYRFKDSNKLVHRWVVEKHLGYPLPSGSVVHHRNKNKRDNRLKNLKVFSSQEEHQKVHFTPITARSLIIVTIVIIIFVFLIPLIIISAQ